MNGRRQTLLVLSNQRKFQIGFSQNQVKRKTNKSEARKNEKQQITKDIRSFFAKVGTTKSCSNKRGQLDTTDVVELSD